MSGKSVSGVLKERRCYQRLAARGGKSGRDGPARVRLSRFYVKRYVRYELKVKVGHGFTARWKLKLTTIEQESFDPW
jgi:hypothetical protein